MAVKRKPPRQPLKHKAPDIPPEVGRRFFELARALHAEKNPVEADKIAGDAGHLPRQHYTGRLRRNTLTRARDIKLNS
jgi:hypothetical protein